MEVAGKPGGILPERSPSSEQPRGQLPPDADPPVDLELDRVLPPSVLHVRVLSSPRVDAKVGEGRFTVWRTGPPYSPFSARGVATDRPACTRSTTAPTRRRCAPSL
jgi:hypothetical protein